VEAKVKVIKRNADFDSRRGPKAKLTSRRIMRRIGFDRDRQLVGEELSARKGRRRGRCSKKKQQGPSEGKVLHQSLKGESGRAIGKRDVSRLRSEGGGWKN